MPDIDDIKTTLFYDALKKFSYYGFAGLSEHARAEEFNHSNGQAEQSSRGNFVGFVDLAVYETGDSCDL